MEIVDVVNPLPPVEYEAEDEFDSEYESDEEDEDEEMSESDETGDEMPLIGRPIDVGFIFQICCESYNTLILFFVGRSRCRECRAPDQRIDCRKGCLACRCEPYIWL